MHPGRAFLLGFIRIFENGNQLNCYVPIMRYFFLIVLCAFFVGQVFAEDTGSRTSERSLVERLGFPPATRVLIINADDFGMNHATNEGTFKALKTGAVTSSTIMFCCPWAEEAVSFGLNTPKVHIPTIPPSCSEGKRPPVPKESAL